MSSIKEVANLAGVSVATVSRVLNGHKQISEETRESVRKAVERLAYVPNITAQSLRRQGDFSEANFSGADLENKNFQGADLRYADFRGSNLRRANLSGANLSEANLYGADLREADLSGAILVGANLARSDISGSVVSMISTRHTKLEETKQLNLKIPLDNALNIEVDNVEFSQFIELLLFSETFRNVISTIILNSVLVLGRFTAERKIVLNSIREHLRDRGYIPIVVDIEKPITREFEEKILTLAGISRFVIADVSDFSILPTGLMHLPSVPIQPIVQIGEPPYDAFIDNLARYPSLLPVYQYENPDQIIDEMTNKVILPAEEKINKLSPKPVL